MAELSEYQQQENLWEFVPDEVPATLNRLRSMGFTLVVISNANGRLRHLFRRIGLADSVDALVDSHEEGVEKPDPRLFHIALQRVNGDAQSAVYIGDLYHVDVIGARRAGIQPVLLDVEGLYRDVDCPTVGAFRDFPALLVRSAFHTSSSSDGGFVMR
jgi:putative hydrolase of the HAD superfamily